jgi:hypothetical protein
MAKASKYQFIVETEHGTVTRECSQMIHGRIKWAAIAFDPAGVAAVVRWSRDDRLAAMNLERALKKVAPAVRETYTIVIARSSCNPLPVLAGVQHG